METASPNLPVTSALAPLANEGPPDRFKGRGIPFHILLDQVRNTAPFIFGDGPLTEREPHLAGLRDWATKPATLKNAEMSHADYFRLCLQCDPGWKIKGICF